MLLDIPKIEKIELENVTAKIKYDSFNKRIKIVNLKGNLENLITELTSNYNKIGKIFSIVQKDKVEDFKEQDFIIEAKVDQFLNGEPGYFISKFLTPERKMSIHLPEEEEVLIRSREYIGEGYNRPIYEEYTIRDGKKEDSEALAMLYDEVFETYPSPMNDPDYIQSAMDDHVFFKVALYDNKIVSSASADMDPDYLSAEMTDCATTKAHRGNGLMGRLIFELERELKTRQYKVFYSTARAVSTGMNIVFAKHDYEYGGRLVNHCHICGQFENMNIWAKVL